MAGEFEDDVEVEMDVEEGWGEEGEEAEEMDVADETIEEEKEDERAGVMEEESEERVELVIDWEEVKGDKEEVDKWAEEK